MQVGGNSQLFYFIFFVIHNAYNMEVIDLPDLKEIIKMKKSACDMFEICVLKVVKFIFSCDWTTSRICELL